MTSKIAYGVSAVTLLLVAGIRAPRPPLALGLALPIGAGVAVALFLLLSGGRRPRRRVRRGRLPALAAKGVFLSVNSAGEEVVWRWFVLGGLNPILGPAPAFCVSTTGFALAHRAGLGWQGVRVHLLTGAAFGGVFLLTGSLLAAVAAHALYNLLVAAAVESDHG